MTHEQEIAMFEELMQEYHERYHEDPEFYNPVAYDEYLNEITDAEFIDEYNRVFGFQ